MFDSSLEAMSERMTGLTGKSENKFLQKTGLSQCPASHGYSPLPCPPGGPCRPQVDPLTVESVPGPRLCPWATGAASSPWKQLVLGNSSWPGERRHSLHRDPGLTVTAGGRFPDTNSISSGNYYAKTFILIT